MRTILVLMILCMAAPAFAQDHSDKNPEQPPQDSRNEDRDPAQQALREVHANDPDPLPVQVPEAQPEVHDVHSH